MAYFKLISKPLSIDVPLYSELGSGRTRSKRMVKKCTECGKEFKDKGKICPQCLDAIRHNLTKEGLPPTTRIPVAVPPASVRNVPIDEVQGDIMAHLLSDKNPWGEAPTQQKIRNITDAMKDLLLYKNQKYGDSAINPLCIFTKHLKEVETNAASILVRLDDKLSRIKNADELRTNDVSDIIGYCTLLLISMGVTAEDNAKFKD
jgi:hypothetical protein